MANTNLSSTYAIVDVLDFVVRRYGSNETLMYVEYAKEVKIGIESSSLEITGGKGNPTLLEYFHSKKCNFSAKLPLVSLDCLATKLGTTVKKGKTTSSMVQELKVNATNKITLAKKPATGTLTLNTLDAERNVGQVFTLGIPATNPNEYSIDAVTNEITFNSAVVEGTKILVCYEFETTASAREIRLNATDLPNMVEVFFNGTLIDEANNRSPVEIKIYKMMVDPKFEMNFTAGQATEVTFDGKCLVESEIEGNKESSFKITYAPYVQKCA